MVQIEEIRAAFAARLKQSLSAHGIDHWGAGARLAKMAGVTPKASSKWLNGESLPGPAKMRAIAETLNVKIEWLQYGSGEGPTIAKATPGAAPDDVRVANLSRPGRTDDDARIPHFDFSASVGTELIPTDYPQLLREVKVSPLHLRELGVTFEDHNQLSIVSGWGQSMEPTIRHRDPLIVDASIRDFTGDGVYLFTWGERLYIKRLQVTDSERFEMISDNAQHKARTIRKDATSILARVLLVWNTRLL